LLSPYQTVEESKRFILGRSGGKHPTTGQMMLASTIAGTCLNAGIKVSALLTYNHMTGAATTITTNPIWLIQTHQATRGAVEVSH